MTTNRAEQSRKLQDYGLKDGAYSISMGTYFLNTPTFYLD